MLLLRRISFQPASRNFTRNHLISHLSSPSPINNAFKKTISTLTLKSRPLYCSFHQPTTTTNTTNIIMFKRSFYAGFYEMLMRHPKYYTKEVVEDERMIGPYPEVTEVNFQYRDHNDHWDDPKERRNFGEPVRYVENYTSEYIMIPHDFIIKSADTPEVPRVEPVWIVYEQFVMLAGVLALFGLSIYLFDNDNIYNNVIDSGDPYAQEYEEIRKRAVQDFMKKYPAVGVLDPNITNNEASMENTGYVPFSHTHDTSMHYTLEKQRERYARKYLPRV